MNILFLTEYQISVQRGGVEKMTAIISEYLFRNGDNVFSVYIKEIDSKYPLFNFGKSYHLCIGNVIQQLSDILNNNNIQVLVLQTKFQYINFIKEAIKRCRNNVKIVFAHHMLPKSEFRYLRFKNYKKTLFTSFKRVPRDILRLAKWSVNYPIIKHRWNKYYKIVYATCDRVVLLSDAYKNEWERIVKNADPTKFAVIPNPCSLEETFQIEQYERDKTDTVVIVARLQESPKKISVALKIWSAIENRHPTWKLQIVGDGEDANYYKELVSTLGLKNVSFEGIQNPIEYYRRGSIFMMTSEHEAWSLTLMEAQQMACVPLAFNSFGAVNEVIINGKTGYIIENNHLEDYINRIEKLIIDKHLRKHMAIEGVKHSNAFKKDAICEKWSILLKTLNT